MKRKILQQTKVKSDLHGGQNDYEVTQAQTDGVKIEDSGSGKPIILRQFEFHFPPGFKGKPKKEEILTESYIKYLENFLWADALEMIMEPKVVFNEKGFKIFATCQARKGHLIPYDKKDQLRPLQDKIQGK